MQTAYMRHELNKKVIDQAGLDELIEDMRHLAFAKYFKDGDEDFANLDAKALKEKIRKDLEMQIERVLQFCKEEGNAAPEDISRRFIHKVPDLIKLLHSDVKAAFDGDPAAESYEEIIIAYPGLYAISVQRFAHALYELDVPILPRLMTEIAHSKTGIDIHPGASLGPGFFIDHGTGVVVGETTRIGQNVKLYQGVTLGALSTRKGQGLKGQKRHPTIGDNVTIYAGATVLGGDTVIGAGSTLAGGVVIKESIPEDSRVM